MSSRQSFFIFPSFLQVVLFVFKLKKSGIYFPDKQPVYRMLIPSRIELNIERICDVFPLRETYRKVQQNCINIMLDYTIVNFLTVLIEACRTEYNEVRPHNSLKYQLRFPDVTLMICSPRAYQAQMENLMRR